MAEVEALKAQLAGLPEAEKAEAEKLRELLSWLPNIPAEDVPEGADEHGNVEQVDRRFGDPAALPAGRLAAPKDHVELGERLGMMDFEAAARMSGARFVVLKRDLARLERALGQFMLDLQTREHGYEEVSPPLLVRDAAVERHGSASEVLGRPFRQPKEATCSKTKLLPRRLENNKGVLGLCGSGMALLRLVKCSMSGA